jgi:hypothetical protein
VKDVDDMRINYSHLKTYTILLFAFLLISGCFTLSCRASDSDNIVTTIFDISFSTGTQLTIDISVTPQKLTTDRVFYYSDILQASSEEIGALKYSVFLMLKDQLSLLFKGITLGNFTMPQYQSGVFTENLDVSLDSAFFNLNTSTNAHEFINGFLDMGATIAYTFPFTAQEGWNNTYRISLDQSLLLDSANTVEVSPDGHTLTWHSSNWDGNAQTDQGQLSLKKQSPTTQATQELIQITFNIDGTTPSNIKLDTQIQTQTISIIPYNILPEFITNINYIPSDGIRLLINNNILTWDDILQQTYQPIINHILTTIENSSYHQKYNAQFTWQDHTTTNTSTPYNIAKMDTTPPITGILSESEIPLTFLGITSRAFFGLLNAGAQATLTSNDINFGAGLENLTYPYKITLTLPNKIYLNQNEVFTWINTTDFSGNFTSDNYQQTNPETDQIEEYITLDISKMDLNIISLFTGTLEMNAAIALTADEYQYTTTLPTSFNLPKQLQLPYLNADAFRLAIEESVFKQTQLSDHFAEKKEKFKEQFSTIIPNIELNGLLDESTYHASLDWDGDITSMDALTPIQTTITSKSLHPIKLNISLLPPTLTIADQAFQLTGLPKKTLVYTILFPKGITIEHSPTNNSNIYLAENTDGRQFIEYTIPPTNYDSTLSLTCKLTASPLYVISILLPLILSLILITILIILIYIFRKRRRGRPHEYKHPPPPQYPNNENYIPPPPHQEPPKK